MKILAIIVMFIALTACGTQTVEPEMMVEPRIRACVNKGIAYFKDIGSYPKLYSYPDAGRRAEDVAIERCRRSTSAFGQ